MLILLCLVVWVKAHVRFSAILSIHWPSYTILIVSATPTCHDFSLALQHWSNVIWWRGGLISAWWHIDSNSSSWGIACISFQLMGGARWLHALRLRHSIVIIGRTHCRLFSRFGSLDHWVLDISLIHYLHQLVVGFHGVHCWRSCSGIRGHALLAHSVMRWTFDMSICLAWLQD